MYDIIINPISGKGKSLKALKEVERILVEKGIGFNIHQTTHPGHAVELASTLTSVGTTDLIVMGGDGTFNEVLCGISSFDGLRLGIIPCGTGNDFVRASKTPTDIKEAVDVILRGETRFVDFIQLDNRRALNCAGAGMDVDVLERYSTMKAFKGKVKYYASLLDTLIHLKFHKINITMDGETMQKSVFLITVANGTCIGGGMPVSPESDPFDGFLNVVFVNEIPKRKVLPMLIKFLKGKHIFEPCTESFKAKEIRIEVLDEGKVEVDGEIMDDKVLNCKIVSDTLRLFC